MFDGMEQTTRIQSVVCGLCCMYGGELWVTYLWGLCICIVCCVVCTSLLRVMGHVVGMVEKGTESYK